MVIKELYIKNFGKLTERHFYLRHGIQILSGENESGKSTLHAFIRAMLFGMERGRGRAAAKDDFTRYEPWDTPGNYAGMMRFSCGGRTFRLERSFDRYTKRASLVCEDDGEELSVEQGDLDMLLGGLTPGLFDSTVSVGQLQAEPGQELYDALENYAANYLETGSMEIDLAAAFRMLKEKKRDVSRALKEEDAAREAQREKLLSEIRYLERDIEELDTEYAQREERLSDIEKSRIEESKTEQSRSESGYMQQEGSEEKAVIGSRNLIFTGIAGLFAGAAGFLSSQGEAVNFLTIGVIAGVAALIGIICLAAGSIMWIRERKTGKNRRAGQEKGVGGRTAGIGETARFMESARALQEQREDTRQRLLWDMEHLRLESKEKEIRRDNLREQWAEWEVSGVQKRLRQSLHALEIAEETLQGTAKEAGNSGTDTMKKKASEIFARITEGRYSRIEFERGQHIFVWDGVRRIPAERLSRGTIEQIYLSVRLAAADMLLEEDVPLIFDDAFAFYDDKRLESALKWLSGQGKQVIIFTCQNREEEIVEKLRG